MKMLMLIDTTHGGIFFSLTYLAAILVTAGMTIFYGFRKGYPKTTWLLILVSGLLFFIIGEKVASYSSGEWMQVFTGFQLLHTDKKTILGGILGLFTGLTLAKHTLRFNRPVLDSFAIALPVGMAISRIGCLMAGCCFGTPTNLPWGIHYDASSWAYKVHLEQGLIHFHDKTSLAVHPVQLYQVIGCLIIALIVWKTRKQWKASGSLFLFSVLCYAGFADDHVLYCCFLRKEVVYISGNFNNPDFSGSCHFHSIFQFLPKPYSNRFQTGFPGPSHMLCQLYGSKKQYYR